LNEDFFIQKSFHCLLIKLITKKTAENFVFSTRQNTTLQSHEIADNLEDAQSNESKENLENPSSN
jgi:hypothetical protein